MGVDGKPWTLNREPLNFRKGNMLDELSSRLATLKEHLAGMRGYL